MLRGLLWALLNSWGEQKEIRRMMRDYRPRTGRAILILVACAALMWALLVAVTARAEGQTLYAAIESGVLNVRSDPSRSGDVMFRLERGESVTMVEAGGSWVRVDRAGDQGWASIDYLSETLPDDLPESATVVGGGRLALRTRPNGDKIGWLKNGQAVKPLALMGGWLRVETGGKSGWVVAEYIDYK